MNLLHSPSSFQKSSLLKESKKQDLPQIYPKTTHMLWIKGGTRREGRPPTLRLGLGYNDSSHKSNVHELWVTS